MPALNCITQWYYNKLHRLYNIQWHTKVVFLRMCSGPRDLQLQHLFGVFLLITPENVLNVLCFIFLYKLSYFICNIGPTFATIAMLEMCLYFKRYNIIM